MARGGSSVNLEPSANQIPQPTVTEQVKLGGEEGGIVEAEWEYSEFVWLSGFLKELPPRYQSLLDLLDVDPDDYSFEIEGFHCYRHERDPRRHCSVERIFVPLVRCGRYHPYTSVKHKRRASARSLDRLEFLEKECRKRHVKLDYLIKIDLTLPRAVSEKWNDGDIQHKIHRAVQDFLLGLQKELFPEHNSQLGAVSNHHYWSTKRPLTPHRHIHLTLPNVTYNKNTDMFHRFKPKIDKDLIKRVWKRCLVKNDLWFGASAGADPVIWTRYIKFERRGQVLFRLSYCSRKPIEDLIKFLKSSDIPDDFDEEFALFLLDYTPRKINLGFLTNLKRFGYSRKSIVMKCPICGGDMYLVRDDYENVLIYDRPPPDIPCLMRNKKGEWCDAACCKDLEEVID